MYELISQLTRKQLTFEQLPLLVLSLGFAEVFYKFHSFLLETSAFLLTWYVLGALYAGIKSLLTREKENSHEC